MQRAQIAPQPISAAVAKCDDRPEIIEELSFVPIGTYREIPCAGSPTFEGWVRPQSVGPRVLHHASVWHASVWIEESLIAPVADRHSIQSFAFSETV